MFIFRTAYIFCLIGIHNNQTYFQSSHAIHSNPTQTLYTLKYLPRQSSMCSLCSSLCTGVSPLCVLVGPGQCSVSSWHPDALYDLEDRWSTNDKQEESHQCWANWRFLFFVIQCLRYISPCCDVFAVFVASNSHSLFVGHFADGLGPDI